MGIIAIPLFFIVIGFCFIFPPLIIILMVIAFPLGYLKERYEKTPLDHRTYKNETLSMFIGLLCTFPPMLFIHAFGGMIGELVRGY